jgi:hypothetical protein
MLTGASRQPAAAAAAAVMRLRLNVQQHAPVFRVQAPVAASLSEHKPDGGHGSFTSLHRGPTRPHLSPTRTALCSLPAARAALWTSAFACVRVNFRRCRVEKQAVGRAGWSHEHRDYI